MKTLTARMKTQISMEAVAAYEGVGGGAVIMNKYVGKLGYPADEVGRLVNEVQAIHNAKMILEYKQRTNTL